MIGILKEPDRMYIKVGKASVLHKLGVIHLFYKYVAVLYSRDDF